MNLLEKNKIGVLFEDDSIIVLNKPAPFLTIPDRYDSSQKNLMFLLQATYPEAFVVHRLDKETSGVIIFTKTAEAHRTLSLSFGSRTVKKQYLAVVCGVPFPSEGRIEAPIAEHPKKGEMIISGGGKESVTDYKVIESYGRFALVELFPLTGRTHQLRIHLKSIGHPLAVDPVYGELSSLKLSQIKPKYKRGSVFDEEKPLIGRCTLHAKSITFEHPADNRIMTVESPVPRDMSALINQLSKLKKIK